MSIDQKLRRAFRNATPNVLGALPAKEENTKKNRRPSKKWMEALPAVASLAMIVAAVALAIPYLGNFGGPGSLNQPTGSGTHPGVTTQPTEDPWEKDPELERKVIADALAIVEQEGETLAAEIKETNFWGYRYQVTVERQGILYKLYYGEEGNLGDIRTERTETATGLIPESVAYAMAWTDWGQKLEDYTIELKTVPEGFPYYEIRAVEPLSPWEFTRYVHAENGGVYLYDPQGTEDKERILTDARSIVAPEGEALVATIVELQGDPHDYMVNIEREGVIYRLFYARSGLLQDLQVTRTPQSQGYIPENVAFHLAELEQGTACELRSVEMKTDPEKGIYYDLLLETQNGAERAHCYVDAYTGAVTLVEETIPTES